MEPVLEDPATVGGQPGAPADLEGADLAVAQPPVALQLLALPPDGRQPPQVPSPGAAHRTGPGSVAGQLGHDDLADGQDEHLGNHPDEVERAVALEHGEELMAALQLLERHRSGPRLVIVAPDQRRVDTT